MMGLFESAWVIARRDFVATVYSRSFILFLLAPLVLFVFVLFAAQMAEGVRKLGGCDIGLATTGIAGPGGGGEDKPVGLVYVGLCGTDGRTVTRRILANPKYGRSDIKFWFSQYALNFLRLYLMGRLKPDREEAPESPEVNLKPV